MADCMDESLKTLMEVTGVDVETAKKVLILREQNLDQAINFILDGNEIPDDSIINVDSITPSTSNGPILSPNMPVLDVEDDVRAPIPPKRETLLLPEEDNFRFRKRRNVQNLCPLRNFEREGELLEEELYASEQRSSSRPARKKRVRLEDIFRPPVDICFGGSFQAARDHSTELNRWLIVNVQDHTEFLSQCLNRDVWSNINLKNIIKSFFTFWQVSVDNIEGARFKTFYNVESCPYVCIIDPRTGEHKMNIQNFEMKPDNFIKEFYMFLKEHGPYPYSQEVEKSNGYYDIIFKDINGVKIPIDDSIDILCNSLPSTSNSCKQENSNNINNTNDLNKIPFEKLTEEEQIELAIKQSLNDAKTSNGDTDDEGEDADVESWSDDEDSFEKHLGSDKDPKTKLQLRLPNDKREILNWPNTSKVRAIKLYIKLKYPDITKGQYKIINMSTFPKRNVLDLNDDLTFDKCDLHKDSILYIHPDD